MHKNYYLFPQQARISLVKFCSGIKDFFHIMINNNVKNTAGPNVQISAAFLNITLAFEYKPNQTPKKIAEK